MIQDFFDEQMIACKIIKKLSDTKSISHAYLIETNNYYRGFDFALAFAKTLFCPENKIKCADCGNCTQCERINNRNFSELEIIEPEGMWIKKEQLDSLQKNFSTKSLEGTRKVYIINHAEKLNQASSNSILKFLEEPEENITAILITNNVYSLLETIVSRCQIIKLNDMKSQTNNHSTLEKVGNYLFNNINDINNFYESNSQSEIILETIKFIEQIEKMNIEVLLDENHLCSTFLKDKIMFEQFINIMILFFKDILDFKIRKKVSVFDDYKEKIMSISDDNSVEKITKKIRILTNIQERIKYNCNLNLILDKLIILLGGV